MTKTETDLPTRGNKLHATTLLHKLGQSLWLDNITRDLIEQGTLKRYIHELSVTGLTSNPTIFEQAIKNSTAYDRDVAAAVWPEHSELKVVSVVNAMIYSLEEIGLLRDRRTARAHRAIGDAFQVLKGAPLKISGEVIAGEVTPQIIDRAENWGADLIVVGTHERRGLKRLLFGGTSAAVANRAHCSVKVIRGRSGSRNGKSFLRRSSPSVRNMGTLYRLEENVGWRRAA